MISLYKAVFPRHNSPFICNYYADTEITAAILISRQLPRKVNGFWFCEFPKNKLLLPVEIDLYEIPSHHVQFISPNISKIPTNLFIVPYELTIAKRAIRTFNTVVEMVVYYDILLRPI